MVTGSASGDRAPLLSAFINEEGGYTTIAVALALLLSVTMAFGVATAEWAMARSQEVQQVADAAAMAGANVVASFSTVAQVLDACVLSMGLAGIVTYGAGLVLAGIPGAEAAATEAVSAGEKILDARRDFARSSAEGLRRLEEILPAIVVVRSAEVVTANSRDGLSYVGCAVPYPMQSESDFSSLEADVDQEGLSDAAERMGEASSRVEEAQERVDAARERAWEADCVADPYCLAERAGSLAGLSAAENPTYATSALWNFGVPLSRARSYYAARLSLEGPLGPGAEELANSCARAAFYAYALAEVRGGHYAEGSDGMPDMDLPSLPHNASETKSCVLYTQGTWPCTDEGTGRVLHCSPSCPGALGPASGVASLADIDSGAVGRCSVCGMDVGVMSAVAAASTSTSNGFEHYWRIIVDASGEYSRACEDLAVAQEEAREVAEEAAGAFETALEALSVVRPKLCPPGAWGCVAFVVRDAGVAAPSALMAAFGSEVTLPAGMAIAGATLARDGATAENNVLADFLDGVEGRAGLVGGVLDGVMSLWGRLLVGYGSAYGSVADAAGGFLDGLDGVLGGTVGAWLKGRMREVMEAAGLTPVDMALRKPVLASTDEILSKAGLDRQATVRSLVNALPADGDGAAIARALGIWGWDQLTAGQMTIAELTIPGTDITIPLGVDPMAFGRST